MIFRRAITLSYLRVSSFDQTVRSERSERKGEQFGTSWYLGNLCIEELSSCWEKSGIVLVSDAMYIMITINNRLFSLMFILRRAHVLEIISLFLSCRQCANFHPIGLIAKSMMMPRKIMRYISLPLLFVFWLLYWLASTQQDRQTIIAFALHWFADVCRSCPSEEIALTRIWFSSISQRQHDVNG